MNKVFGYWSLILRLLLSIAFGMLFMFLGHVQNTFVLGFMISLPLNLGLFFCKLFIVKENGINIKGLRKSRYYEWNDLRAAKVYFESWGKVTYYKLYFYRKNLKTDKILLMGLLWFERKTLIAELQKHVRVDKDPPMPKLTDIW